MENDFYHLKTGSTITEYSFDAWGRRRNALNWSYDLTGQPALFADRGFTSHEFLADFNLYNMNGRLYDPVVGRFLSPDPYIADPSFSQSYNRYAYALNNPLKFTDPSGEKLKWPKFEWFNAIPVIGQFDYLMQFINDNTTKTRQKMVNAGVPDFGAGISFSGNGNVNFSGSYRVQEVFNTQNINKGNPDVVLNELVQVRRDYGPAWHGQSGGDDWLATVMQMGIDPVSNIATVSAGFKYTASNFLREGYWQGVNGNYYSLSLTQEGSRGWVFYKGSADMAKNSVKCLGMVGQGLGYLSLGYSTFNFATNPNWGNTIDVGIGISSIAFWEVGAIYYFGYGMVNASSGERNQIKNNIMNGRDPLYNVYNPSLGY